MNTKLLLASLAVSAAPVALAATQVPAYTSLDLSALVSNRLFHGNTILADINNDGNLELIVKGRDPNNDWATTIGYLTGDGFGYNAFTEIPDPDGCSWERILVPIDYNADGNVDIILASSWNAKLLKGDGTGNFEMVDTDKFNLDGEISIDGDDAEKWYNGLVAVADFNLDGYPDIVTFCGNPRDDQGEPVLFLNNGGDGSFTKSYGVGLIPQRAGTIAVGDFNRDGAPDLAVSGWNDDFGNHCIRVYKNNGDATFTEVASDDFNNVQAGTDKGQLLFADFDGDGWLDLFVCGESCPQGWAKLANIYKNNNGTSFSKMATAFPGVKVAGADWCDINGDGLADLVYSGEGDNGCVTVVVINEGNGTFDVKDDLMEGHRGGATVQVADFNNNGVPDVMLMGYNDGGPQLFQVYNGLCSRGMNTAPSAPSNLNTTSDGGKTTFSWDAGSDNQTDATALRYNLYVKTTDGALFTIIPADPATGILRCADVNTALTTTTYTLNVKSSDIKEWGVQTIDNGKMASSFATASSGVDAIAGEGETALEATYAGRKITVNADATLTVMNPAGAVVSTLRANAGEPVGIDLPAGVYVVNAATTAASSSFKIIVR